MDEDFEEGATDKDFAEGATDGALEEGATEGAREEEVAVAIVYGSETSEPVVLGADSSMSWG